MLQLIIVGAESVTDEKEKTKVAEQLLVEKQNICFLVFR
jgi:hypothetical protein